MNATYDWVGMGAAWDLEVDHAVGSDQLYVGLNIFSGNDYKCVLITLLESRLVVLLLQLSHREFDT